ncbi:MAG: hypothetical protein ACMUHB_01840 [Thermoplasmatota archaeon]
MAKNRGPGWYVRLRKDTRSLWDHPAFRYWKMERYTKRSYRKMFKGLLLCLKGLAYVLIMVSALGEFGEIPVFMLIISVLMGLKGIYNLIKGSYLMIRARILGKRSRGKRGKRLWKYYFAWTNTSFLIILVSLSFLFITEHLSAPHDIGGNLPWFVWPFVYLGMFILWSVTVRSMLLGGARAFKVGDKMARVRHDRKLISRMDGERRKGLVALLLTSYIPVIGLVFMIGLISLLKLLLRWLLEVVFDISTASSIGEELLRVTAGAGLSLSDLSPFFATWFGPILFYILMVALIGIFSNLRTRAMLSTHYQETFQSSMGRRIGLVNELRSNRGRKGEEED